MSPSPSPPPSRKGEDDEENREAGKATEVGDSPDAKKKRTSDRSEQRSPKKKRKKEEEDALVTKYHSVVGNRKLRIKGGSADGGVTTKEEVDEMERFLKEHPEVLSKQNESVDVMKELDELLQED